MNMYVYVCVCMSMYVSQCFSFLPNMEQQEFPVQWQHAVLAVNRGTRTNRRKRNGSSLELQLHSTFLQLEIHCWAKPLYQRRFETHSVAAPGSSALTICRSTTVLDFIVNQPKEGVLILTGIHSLTPYSEKRLLLPALTPCVEVAPRFD